MTARARSVAAMLVLVSLALVTVDYRLGEQGPVAALRRGAITVFDPLQEGFAVVVTPIRDAVTAVRQFGSLRAENEALAADLNQARSRLQVQSDLERQIADLRGQLALRDTLGLQTIGATVIARPPGAFDWSLLIDVGTDAGVSPGAAVISGGGLVGRVTAVTSGTARVQLARSPDGGYGVRIADTGHHGLLSGRGGQPYALELLDPLAGAAPGVQVVTQTFAGSRIPDGIPVGTVLPAPAGGDEGLRMFQVEPAVDVGALQTVQVVIDVAPAPSALPDPPAVAPFDTLRPPPPATPPPAP